MAKTELEMLQDITAKIDGNAAIQTKEVEALKKEAKELTEKYEAEVKALVAKNTEQGATLGQIQTEVLELKAKSGRIKTGTEQVKTLFATVADTIAENKDRFIGLSEKKEFGSLSIEHKTVGNIASANNSANYLNYLNWQPGMEPTGQTRFRDIFGTIQSDGDFVSFPRANTPIGEGSFNRQTEAAAKPQVDRDYTMVTLTLKPMAGYAIASRQSLRNIPFLQSWLPTSMMEQLLDAEDADFANSLVGAATGSSTTSGITVNTERLIYFIKNLSKSKFNATAICIDPDKWADILVTKPSNYSLPNVVTVDANGNVKVMGRPVYPVNWLTGGRVLVGDTRKASIVQSEGLTMRTSDSHSTTFVSNEVTFLLERSEGLAVYRPDAFITTTLS